jgi:hypothetical protein
MTQAPSYIRRRRGGNRREITLIVVVEARKKCRRRVSSEEHLRRHPVAPRSRRGSCSNRIGRVEHYELSGYNARNLAQQLHHSAIVQHLSKSLAEEENADQLLIR